MRVVGSCSNCGSYNNARLTKWAERETATEWKQDKVGDRVGRQSGQTDCHRATPAVVVGAVAEAVAGVDAAAVAASLLG